MATTAKDKAIEKPEEFAAETTSAPDQTTPEEVAPQAAEPITYDPSRWTGMSDEDEAKIIEFWKDFPEKVKGLAIIAAMSPLAAVALAVITYDRVKEFAGRKFAKPEAAPQTPAVATVTAQPEENAAVPEEAEESVELKPEELVPGITQFDPQGRDFSRVGRALSRFTTEEAGGPAYLPLEFAFRSVSEEGQLQGELIGTTIWGETEVNLLHVEKEFRGQGVGKKLLSLAEEFVKSAHGSRGVHLWTPSFQGEGFYERAGYEAVARFPIATEGYIDGKQEQIVYYKSLEPDLKKAAEEGDFKTIADYAKAQPERFMAVIDELAEQYGKLAEGLTPYFSKIEPGQGFVLDVEDIKIRLDIKIIGIQAMRDFDKMAERILEDVKTQSDEYLRELAAKNAANSAPKLN